MIQQGKQSSSIKTYVTAIKKLLVLDGYQWQDSEVLLNSLTRACKIINDRVTDRFPISYKLLELILVEVERYYTKLNQPYLEYLYKAIFILSYYGMMRVGEVTLSEHVVKAKNVNVGVNKDKMLLILYTLKTHGYGDRPQEIKISANKDSANYKNMHFCPFKILGKYMKMRPQTYQTDDEPLFVFRDRTPVKPAQATAVLKDMIKLLDVEEKFYSMHSFRIGRTSDLIHFGF